MGEIAITSFRPDTLSNHPANIPTLIATTKMALQVPLTIQPSPTGALGALGANFNEHLTWVNHTELRQVNSHWIRGFIDMHQLNSQSPATDANLQSLFTASAAGFKTILSFKWNYTTLDFPAPGTPGLTAEVQILDALLHIVMGKVDILVIGNEPFIEAKADQQNQRLNIFYETLADAVINFRKTHGASPKQTRLYMGALNRLDLPAKRTPAIQRFLHFIASRPDLDGVDLHLHVPTWPGHKTMLDYALTHLRPEQRFLVTEFSMVWHFKRHMGDHASSHFCQRAGFHRGTKVHEVIDAAITNPMPSEQWADFLSHEPWYMATRGFVLDSMKMYRDTGRLEVATYSFCPMRFRKKPFAEADTPWMLNGVWAPSTVRIRGDGTREENFLWAEEFRRAQR